MRARTYVRGINYTDVICAILPGCRETCILRIIRDSRLYSIRAKWQEDKKKKKYTEMCAQKNMTVNNSFLYPIAP